MKELTTYLLESLACGGVLYACYRLLLDRRVAFGWCRGWLFATEANVLKASINIR